MVLGPEQLEIIVSVITVGVLTTVIANVVNHLLKKSFSRAHIAIERHHKLIKRVNGLDEQALKVKLAKDRTRLALIRRMLVTAIYIIGIVIIISSIPSLKTFSYSLLAGAGVAAIIIGFALQKSMANILAGVMIAVSQPFKIGDRVKFRDDFGTIEDITLRHTVLKTWDNRHLIIPNAFINDDTVQNYSFEDEKILASVDFALDFEADIDKARKIIHDEIVKHPKFLRLKKESELIGKADTVKVRMVDISDSALVLKAHYWVENQPSAFVSSCDIRESVYKRFCKEGIELAYPHRTIVYKQSKRR